MIEAVAASTSVVATLPSSGKCEGWQWLTRLDNEKSVNCGAH